MAILGVKGWKKRLKLSERLVSRPVSQYNPPLVIATSFISTQAGWLLNIHQISIIVTRNSSRLLADLFKRVDSFGKNWLIDSLVVRQCFMRIYVVDSRAASLKRPLLSVEVSVCVWLSVYVCLSATLMLNISETKRFRGSCPTGILQESDYDWWCQRRRHVTL